MRDRQSLWAWPPLFYMALFAVLPTGVVIGCSLLQRDYYGHVLWEFSSAAWQRSCESPNLKILGRSVALAFVVTVVCLAVAYPATLSLARLPVGVRRYFVALLAFPMFISFLLRIYGWINLLPDEWRGGLAAVVLVMTVNYLPFMLLPLLRSIEQIDAALTDAALDLGATPLSAFWHVTLPLSRPGALAGSMLVFVPAVGEYLVPHFIGNGKVSVLGTQIVSEFMERRNWPFAASLATLLLLMVILGLAFGLIGRERLGWRAGKGH